MKNLCLIFTSIIFFNLNLHCQIENDDFDMVVTSKIGYLNNDGILDSVVVAQNTLSKFQPYRLKIYFGDKNGNKKLILATDKAIEPESPNGENGLRTGNGFYGISIEENILWIKNELLRGHFEHKFQYRDNKFKLVGYNFVNSDGRGRIHYVDYNLITGERKTKTVNYETDEIIEQGHKNIKINLLPNLSDFEPNTKKLY